MLRNYFLTAFRYILRNKVQSIIQITSLTLGIAVVIQLGLYVDHEMSYDKFNEKLDRIFRLEFGDFSGNPSAVGHHIKENFPEVEDVVRIIRPETTRLSYTEEQTNQLSKRTDLKLEVITSDSTIFDIFTFPFIQGDPETALRDPNSIVLTESTARALFGNRDPVGEILEEETPDSSKSILFVTGVIHDIRKSHINFDALKSMTGLAGEQLYSGGRLPSGERLLNTYRIGAFWYTYLLLPDPNQKLRVENRINEYFKEPIQDARYFSNEKTFSLRPLGEIYFSKPMQREWGYCLHGNIRQVNILFAIAIFILLIACINYINLTTARASMRAREVGVRKVTGAISTRLIGQFLVESLLTSLVSYLIAITIIQLLLPAFSKLAMVDLNMDRLLEPIPLLLSIASIFVIGLIAGIYPAFYLTSFGTIASLKGEQLKGESSILLRRILLTFQFTISIILVIGILTILRQLEYMKDADPGFNSDLIVNIPTMGFNEENKPVFKNNLLANPNIEMMTYGFVPGDRIQPFPGYVEYGDIELKPTIVWMDPDYFKVMDIDILEGRNFSWDRRGDLMRFGNTINPDMVIINRAALRAYEIESAIGEILTYQEDMPFEVIGVVEDCHFFSMHNNIEPTFYFWARRSDGISIKILPHDIGETIKYIKSTYEQLFPNLSFEYSFLDDTYYQQYEDDERMSLIVSNFALIAILIGCLGLFGLSFFMAARKTKEIGIRKAIGATDKTIFILLSKEFIKWIALSVIIACPVAWFVMNKWLQNFAYRTKISWWIFLVAIILAFSISFVTVAWHAWKTARLNPVEALKYE